MAQSRSQKVQGALALIGAFVPQLGPVVAAAPEVIRLLKGAFTKIGGDEADLDRILAENQIDIDRLANPDSFRHKP